jgi:hypothetical protein
MFVTASVGLRAVGPTVFRVAHPGQPGSAGPYPEEQGTGGP